MEDKTNHEKWKQKPLFFTFPLAHPFHTILTAEVKGKSECDP
jgi:hypothetical protein